MRVILATNILLSAFIQPDSAPYLLIQAWLDKRFDLISCSEQLDEVMRVSRYPTVRRFLLPAEIGWLVNRLRDQARLIRRLPRVDVSADPGDNFLLALAQVGKAAYLVTGDKARLLVLKQHGPTQIVSARDMVKVLNL